MFGGLNPDVACGFKADLWAWDGKQWTTLSTS
jgi:hypothetical protein